VTGSLEAGDNPYFTKFAHRVLWILAWLLFFLGMLAWFIQGANRPVDPILSPALVLLFR
jgi:hypothetical protein